MLQLMEVTGPVEVGLIIIYTSAADASVAQHQIISYAWAGCAEILFQLQNKYS